MELEERVAIVTGASRGIGKALARGLAAEGAAVVCAARTFAPGESELPGTAAETANSITDAGGRALPVRCDVSDVDDLQRLVDETIAQYGRLDILVNNAMAPTRAPFEDATLEQWE